MQEKIIKLLEGCSGKIGFYYKDLNTQNEINNTLRLGFSRLSFEEIEKGIKIIGDTIKELPIDD